MAVATIRNVASVFLTLEYILGILALSICYLSLLPDRHDELANINGFARIGGHCNERSKMRAKEGEFVRALCF